MTTTTTPDRPTFAQLATPAAEVDQARSERAAGHEEDA